MVEGGSDDSCGRPKGPWPRCPPSWTSGRPLAPLWTGLLRNQVAGGWPALGTCFGSHPLVLGKMDTKQVDTLNYIPTKVMLEHKFQGFRVYNRI